MSRTLNRLFHKYEVVPKYHPPDPNAEYFVLRVDNDPAARVALEAYANEIHDDNPDLANELMDWLRGIRQQKGLSI